jgi:uncharacterized membrane protein YraQ (UPF0718 family)
MVDLVKKNKLPMSVFIVYIILFIVNGDLGKEALSNTSYYLIEMFQILPVIFMLTVAIDILIPKEWIIKRLGSRSGIVGGVLALAFGSLSAGPIYAAFPIAKMLHKKGASVSNVVIILSAWAVIKVPMLANEMKFLGSEFMLTRWLLTVVLIMAIGWIMKQAKIPISGEEDQVKKRLYVKEDYCIGCSACQKSMPQVFEMRQGKAYVIHENIEIDMTLLQKNVAKCPTKAIIMND